MQAARCHTLSHIARVLVLSSTTRGNRRPPGLETTYPHDPMLAAWFLVGWRVLGSVSEWKVYACVRYVFPTMCIGADDLCLHWSCERVGLKYVHMHGKHVRGFLR
jgi:hypothetical protein